MLTCPSRILLVGSQSPSSPADAPPPTRFLKFLCCAGSGDASFPHFLASGRLGPCPSLLAVLTRPLVLRCPAVPTSLNSAAAFRFPHDSPVCGPGAQAPRGEASARLELKSPWPRWPLAAVTPGLWLRSRRAPRKRLGPGGIPAPAAWNANKGRQRVTSWTWADLSSFKASEFKEARFGSSEGPALVLHGALFEG